MVQVTELSYMGIGVKNPDEWKNFAAGIIGMELAEGEERDRCYLRMDYWHHRIVLHTDDSDDLLYLGFRVAGPEEFREMQKQLAANGIQFRVGSDEEAGERHVLEVLKLNDPDGNPIEIFHGPHVQYRKPFHPGRGMHGRFKTGSGGIGTLHHPGERRRRRDPLLQCARDARRASSTSFRIGKQIVTPVFMHCNDRDHSVAFGIGGEQKRINHLMVEVENFDDLGLTYDFVRKHNLPIRITPGKHSNDHMFSFYVGNPSGWMWEYGWGGRPATHQSEYYLEDIYGHEFQPGAFD